MFGSKCRNCERKIKKEWNFCPYCGFSVKSVSIFDEIEREFSKLSRMFSFKVSNLGEGGIKIMIKGGEPKTQKREEKVLKFKGEVLEPEEEVVDMGNKKIIKIKLPGVKEEREINVRKLENSVEIRAVGKNKAYFKLIPIKPHSNLKYNFENETLTLEIEV